jgi:hypothetical protein
MEKSLLIKRLIEREDANKKLTEAYNLSISYEGLDPADVFTRCAKFIKEISDLSYDFEYLTNEAPKLDLSRKDFRCLCDTICEYLGDTIKTLCINPVFTSPSRLEGCPINTNDLVMYTTKPFDVNAHQVVEFDKDKYKTIRCFAEKTSYYEIYLTILDLI